jgi:uncharacterized membrane protein
MYDVISEILINCSNFVEAHGAETASQIVAYDKFVHIYIIGLSLFWSITSILAIVCSQKLEDKDTANFISIGAFISNFVPLILIVVAVDGLMKAFLAPNLIVLQYLSR